MKTLVIAIALVFLVASQPLFAGPKNISKETMTFDGKARTYYLYIPKNLSADTAAPVILMFHGTKRNGLSLVEKWADLADKEGVILVGPDSFDSLGWQLSADSPDFLQALVEQVKTRHPIQPRRVYLFGHSAGACYALLLSMVESEYFAATAIHAGILGEGNFFTIDMAKRKIPIFIASGTEDAQFPIDQVRSTRDALVAKGIPVELDEMKRHDHWYYDLAPKINRKAWDFLKKQELAGDPNFRVYRR